METSWYIQLEIQKDSNILLECLSNSYNKGVNDAL